MFENEKKHGMTMFLKEGNQELLKIEKEFSILNSVFKF